jgi:G3E family GTPase
MAGERGPVDLTIVAGFLGAGKTTLVNHLLANAGGRRLAVLVNDFGEINIDAKLIARRTDRVISLANGCICCDLGDNIFQTLFGILEQDAPPDGIVIETSGVADPAKLAVLGRVGKFFRLNATIVLVDAAHVRAHAEDRYLADTIRRQIAAADLLIVNKSDIVADDDRAALDGWIAEIAPKAARIPAVRGEVPIDILLGTHRGAISDAHRHHRDHDHDHAASVPHGDGFTAWSFTADRPFRTAALRQVLESLPPWILRGKGVLWFDDRPGRSATFHLVGGRVDLAPGAAWEGGTRRSELVFIAAAQPPRDFAPWRARLMDALSEED